MIRRQPKKKPTRRDVVLVPTRRLKKRGESVEFKVRAGGKVTGKVVLSSATPTEMGVQKEMLKIGIRPNTRVLQIDGFFPHGEPKKKTAFLQEKRGIGTSALRRVNQIAYKGEYPAIVIPICLSSRLKEISKKEDYEILGRFGNSFVIARKRK